MLTVNIHEAKTLLSRLVERAARGESFIIAKAGRPLVKVVALDAAADGAATRLGFMCREIAIPDDFDRMGDDEIAALFVAQARIEGIPLMTTDALIHQYGEGVFPV